MNAASRPILRDGASRLLRMRLLSYIDLMLRACEPMVVCSSAGGGKGVALWRCGGRGWWRHDLFLACGCLQAVSHQAVVGEGEPAQGGVDLGHAAPGKPGAAPRAQPSTYAFATG